MMMSKRNKSGGTTVSDNRQFIMKIDGSAVTEHTFPFRLLAGVLNGIQQTFYYIALAEVKKEESGRGKIPQDIQQACELRRVLEKPGSYKVLAESADKVLNLELKESPCNP